MKPGKDVFAAIDNSAALRSRTSLGEWMRANYGGLKARLDEHVPNWKVLADLFADAGLTDRFGNRPKPQAVRRLWQRIKKEMAEKPLGKRRPTAQPTPTTASTLPPHPTAQPSQTTADILAMLSTGRKVPDPLDN